MPNSATARRTRGKRAIRQAQAEARPDTVQPAPYTPEMAKRRTIVVPGQKRGNKVSGAYRVETLVDDLYNASRIGNAEWNAGDDYLGWQRLAEGTGRGVADLTGIRVDNGAGGCPTARKLDAVAKLSIARSILSHEQRLVMDCVAECWSWADLAQSVLELSGPAAHVTQYYAKRWLIEALTVLANTRFNTLLKQRNEREEAQ